MMNVREMMRRIHLVIIIIQMHQVQLHHLIHKNWGIIIMNHHSRVIKKIFNNNVVDIWENSNNINVTNAPNDKHIFDKMWDNNDNNNNKNDSDAIKKLMI